MGQIKNIKLHIVTDIKNSIMVVPSTKRVIIKKRRKKFIRSQSERRDCVGVSWRKPKGIDSCAEDSKVNILCPVLDMEATDEQNTCVLMVFVSLLSIMSKMSTHFSC